MHPDTANLTIERVRDLQRWRRAAEEVDAGFYTLELMLALYDHAPAILGAAEECFELRAEVEELRDELRRQPPRESPAQSG